MAECHPVGFQWVMEAKARGATVIHVDPRFTRTSALADLHVPLRAGSDIVFLGAIINHVLSRGLYFREYVEAYTNAATLLSEDFADTEDLDGVFSGLSGNAYDKASWAYEDALVRAAAGSRGKPFSRTSGDGSPSVAESLDHPRSVFSVVKRHFARYTPSMVQRACGVPEPVFEKVCDLLVANSGRERTTALVYSVGWTQHTVGVQYIRTAAILQTLLGNMGRPGGGILALRGHASIQGSTDIPTLFDLLPGYLPMPAAGRHACLQAYLDDITMPRGFWANTPAYMISLLKAWWGAAAVADNDYCYDYLPRLTGDHSTYATVVSQIAGETKGYFLFGQNPAVGSANARMQRLGMARLDWLVVRDLTMIESATFWDNGPEIETGEMVTSSIGTEVFFLPAAAHTEKSGSFTNTQRMLQWHHEAVPPSGDARSDLWFTYELGRRLRAKLASSDDPADRALLDLTWDYPVHGPYDEPSAEAVLAEVNGYGADGAPLAGFAGLRDDGSTSCGCWIYSGVYADGVNQAARRVPGSSQSWVAPDWGWAWPANRRMLYNRASADPAGKPWSSRKAYVWWDEEAGKWTGHDVPDFPVGKAPSYRPAADASGVDAIAGDEPFIMQADGKAWLFAPAGLADGPLPAHYEPQESPFENPLYGQEHNPVRQIIDHPENPLQPDASPVYPYVATTYRLTEHHTAGGMSRTLPYLAELQPEFFCEVSPALALERGLINGGWATIVTARTAVEARVLVTPRMKTVMIDGRPLHQVGLPYHWGANGLVTGDAANELAHLSLDPNVHIQEVKAMACDIRAGRRPRGPALLELVAEYARRAGIEPPHE
jgi:formate dehydrogenase major subunit